MTESITDLLKKIEAERAGCRPKLDKWANEQLVAVRADILRLEREDAYRRFLIRYIKDQHRKLGNERDEPLCSCGNDCSLIRGKLPPQVRGSDTLEGGIEEFVMHHPGHPAVLFEADDSYRKLQAEVITELQRIWTGLKNNAIPESDRSADGTTLEMNNNARA